MGDSGVSDGESCDTQEVERLIEKQIQSGLTVQAFCQTERVPKASFYAWKKRLREESGVRETFTPVTLVGEAISEHQTVDVRFPSGVVMQLPTGNEHVLRQVVEVLIASKVQP